jgi:hypothetical protein
MRTIISNLALALIAAAAFIFGPTVQLDIDGTHVNLTTYDRTTPTLTDTPTILPDGAPDWTPTTDLDGVQVPDESPDGAPPVGWADNSPLYRDGWILRVNDSTTPITVQWHYAGQEV